MSQSPVPDISCVIPAFERLDLFARCLVSLVTQVGVNLEIVVSDDSRHDQIESFVGRLSSLSHPIIYAAGPKSGNPVDNWNAGLDRARGRFAQLIHQDEFLIDPSFLGRALARLEESGAPAVFGQVLPVGVDRTSRYPLARSLAKALGARPWTLFGINWLGPTGAMVFRNTPGFRFDRTLVNTVDVDLFFRILGPNGRPVMVDGPAIASLGHHAAQISRAIDPAEVSLRELDTVIRHRPGITPAQIARLQRLWRWRLRRSLSAPSPLRVQSP